MDYRFRLIDFGSIFLSFGVCLVRFTTAVDGPVFWVTGCWHCSDGLLVRLDIMFDEMWTFPGVPIARLEGQQLAGINVATRVQAPRADPCCLGRASCMSIRYLWD